MLANRNKKIRVAHFIGSLQVGGAENQVATLISNFDKNLFDLHLVTFRDVESGFYEILGRGVSYYCINYRRRSALLALYRLYRYIKLNKIDILHCHMYHASVKGALIGRLASTPVILTSEHGKNTWKRPWHHSMEKYVVNPAVDCRVAVSDDIRQIRIREDGVDADKIIVIPNAVDTNNEELRDYADCTLLGAVGRLVDAKDYLLLVEAIRLVLDGGYDVRLKIAGEGSERPSIEKKIMDLGLSGRVELSGNQNIQLFLPTIHMFVMSSKREGVPVSLLEAMASGLPIVSTNVGGIPEVLLDKQEGLLSDAGKPELLANNICKMIDDEGMRAHLGKNARQRVTRCYGIDRVAGQWSELYKELLLREYASGVE